VVGGVVFVFRVESASCRAIDGCFVCCGCYFFFFRFGLASEGGWLGQRADERGVRHVRGRRRPQGFSPGHTAREHHRNPDP
jgi:hypothetical protein